MRQHARKNNFGTSFQESTVVFRVVSVGLPVHMNDAEMLDAIADATLALEELHLCIHAILERVRPALARVNRISDEMDENDDLSLLWDATGLTAFSQVVEELCDSLQRHERLDSLAGS